MKTRKFISTQQGLKLDYYTICKYCGYVYVCRERHTCEKKEAAKAKRLSKNQIKDISLFGIRVPRSRM